KWTYQNLQSSISIMRLMPVTCLVVTIGAIAVMFSYSVCRNCYLNRFSYFLHFSFQRNPYFIVNCLVQSEFAILTVAVDLDHNDGVMYVTCGRGRGSIS